MGVKLLLLKMTEIAPSKVTIIIEYIINSFRDISVQMSIHSEISLISKLFNFITMRRKQIKNNEELFEIALKEMLLDLIQ